jgi:hypothetical protein
MVGGWHRQRHYASDSRLQRDRLGNCGRLPLPHRALRRARLLDADPYQNPQPSAFRDSYRFTYTVSYFYPHAFTDFYRDPEHDSDTHTSRDYSHQDPDCYAVRNPNSYGNAFGNSYPGTFPHALRFPHRRSHQNPCWLSIPYADTDSHAFRPSYPDYHADSYPETVSDCDTFPA